MKAKWIQKCTICIVPWETEKTLPVSKRQIQVALMVFKALNDLAPDYLSSMFTERSSSGCLKGLYEQIKCPFTKNQLPKKEL